MTIKHPFSPGNPDSGPGLVLSDHASPLVGLIRRRDFWIGFGIILLWGVVSRLILDAHSYFDAEDALNYAATVRTRQFSQFDAAGSGWQLLCAAIDALLPVSSEATAAGKLVARVSGTLLLPLLYTTLVATTGRVALSVATTLFFSASFCPWWYSLQPDKYVPQLLLLALALALVITRQRPPSGRFLVALGLVYFLAVIVHTDSGLVCLSILPLLYQTMRTRGVWPALGQGLLSAGVMFAALAVYFVLFLVIFIKPASMLDGLHWIMSYTGESSATRPWGHWHANSLALVFVGLARAVFTTEFVFAIPAIFSKASARFPDKILVEEQWLGAQLPHGLQEVGLGLLACAVLAVCVVVVAGTLGSRELIRDRQRKNWHAIASVLCYLVPALLFFAWWEPTNNEFWIAPWYAIVLLLGLAMAKLNWKYLVTSVTACAVILAACNGLLGIYPRLDANSDYWMVRQAPVAKLAHRDDLVVDYEFMAENYMIFLSEAPVFRASWHCKTQAGLVQDFRKALDSYPDTKSVYMTALVTETTATSNALRAGSSKCDEIIGRFFKELPPPDEWITVDGRRLARYEAPQLRAYLARQ